MNEVVNEPILLQYIINDNEWWIYGYDIETNNQSSEITLLNEPKLKNARSVRSNAVVFTDFIVILILFYINFYHNILRSVKNTIWSFHVACLKRFIETAKFTEEEFMEITP